jgi:hypothetical protein
MGCTIHQMNISHNIGKQFTSNFNNCIINFCVDPMLLENFIAKKHALGLT